MQLKKDFGRLARNSVAPLRTSYSNPSTSILTAVNGPYLEDSSSTVNAGTVSPLFNTRESVSGEMQSSPLRAPTAACNISQLSARFKPTCAQANMALKENGSTERTKP